MEAGKKEQKTKTSVSLNKHLVEWIDKQIGDNNFTSRTNAIEISLAEMKGRRESLEFAELTVNEIKTASLDAITEVQKTVMTNEYMFSILLKISSRHPELVDEINEMIKTPHESADKKKTIFT